jgi:hypothetical protein
MDLKQVLVTMLESLSEQTIAHLELLPDCQVVLGRQRKPKWSRPPKAPD